MPSPSVAGAGAHTDKPCVLEGFGGLGWGWGWGGGVVGLLGWGVFIRTKNALAVCLFFCPLILDELCSISASVPPVNLICVYCPYSLCI